MKATIALVDDHVLLRNGLASLLKDLDYDVVFEADNGAQMMEKLALHPSPQVILMDINMPVMNGIQATLWLKNHYPDVKVLVLSMLDDENSIVQMVKNGARGYVLKDSEPDELKTAIQAVLQKGFYYTEMVTGKLIHALSQGDQPEEKKPAGTLRLNEKEIEFLKWACTDLSYKEIADKMGVSPRTVDGYRDALHDKLEVNSRIGMVLYAIKNGIVKV